LSNIPPDVGEGFRPQAAIREANRLDARRLLQRGPIRTESDGMVRLPFDR
jgi:hypothetical protein